MVYEILIEAVRARPYLYEKSHPNYMKPDWNIKGFSEVADCINNTCGVTLSGENVKTIWTNLCGDFKKVYNQNKLLPTGSSAQKETFQFYDSLSFLEDHINHRPALSSFTSNRFNQNRSLWNNSILTPNHPTMSPPVKTPQWDQCAIKKIETQDKIVGVLKGAKSLIEKNSNDIIHALNQPELHSSEDNDYFTLFYENLMQVQENQRDLCIKEIKKYILSLKQKED